MYIYVLLFANETDLLANMVHDVRRAKQNGNYPVKVRVTYDRRSKYFETGFDLTEAEDLKLSEKRLTKKLGMVKQELSEIEAKGCVRR